MKGVEKDTGLRMSEVIAEVTGFDAKPDSGDFWPELGARDCQSRSQQLRSRRQCVPSSLLWRWLKPLLTLIAQRYANRDVIGTEIRRHFLKDLIAVAIGIVNGVGYGENTKASIMTRGLAEISRFAVAYGLSQTPWLVWLEWAT
jgi:glycerol-3-phosphate dehydrogenase (NAD(P)+)